MLQFVRMPALGMIIAASAAIINTGTAFGHGCQAQGGCCTVGGACIRISPISPIYMMFAVVGASGVAMLAFYGRSHRNRLGAIFNIFV